MPSLKTLYREAVDSARDTIAGCRWVFDELVSTEAKRHIARSLICLFVSALTTTVAVPYIMRFVIDTAGDAPNEALVYLLTLAGIFAFGTLVGSLHDHYREQAWNRNFHTVHIRLVEKLYQRTHDEIVSDRSEVGAEQIESLKDKVQNIIYLFLFESSVVFSTIIGATIFLFLTVPVAGCVAVLLTLFNFIWFFFCNAILDEKIAPLDEKFRRFSRRLVEHLNMVTSVKVSGVERKIVTQIGNEILEPLQQDLRIWGYWFQKIDFWRRLINALIPVALLSYGVYQGWSAGVLTAVSGLTFMITREYGFVGHLMRHLASQVARIKATREALMQPPAFKHDEGIIFEEEATHAS